MMQAKDYFELGSKFHGHKCPAMPLGLRAGAAAIRAVRMAGFLGERNPTTGLR